MPRPLVLSPSLRFSESFRILPSYGTTRPCNLTITDPQPYRDYPLHNEHRGRVLYRNAMGKGPETPPWKRHCVSVYAFDLAMLESKIARELELKRSTVNSLVQAARTRSSTSDLADLQAAVDVQPRSGRLKRADPVMSYLLLFAEVFRSCYGRCSQPSP